LKNNLVNRTTTIPEPGKGTDFYEYSSDDSFIDDGEYDDYVEPDTHSSKNVQEEIIEEDVFFVNDKNATEEIVQIIEEEVSSDEEGKTKRQPKRAPEIAPDEDLTLEPEVEKALKSLQNKIQELGLHEKNMRVIPHELDSHFGEIAHLRSKYYPKGIPSKLVKRLQHTPGLNFADKTIRDRLKSCLKTHERENVGNEIEELKTQLRDSVRDDLVKTIAKRRDKNAKDHKEEKLPTDEECKSMEQDELTKKFNDLVRILKSYVH
jgi:hypothetical protein